MWIVPKTLSAFVPATEVWRGVSEERAWMLEQSVTANGKLMSKQYWLKRLKKADSILLQYGQTLRPSHQQNFTDIHDFKDSLKSEDDENNNVQATSVTPGKFKSFPA